jgi:CheY-like chemotaxis protein
LEPKLIHDASPSVLTGGQWVLIVDDDTVGGRALARYVYTNVRCPVRLVTGLAQLQFLLEHCSPAAAVLLDYELGAGASGIDAMHQLRASGWSSACAFVTGASYQLKQELASEREQPPVFARGGQVSHIIGWLRNALGRGGSGTYPRMIRS